MAIAVFPSDASEAKNVRVLVNSVESAPQMNGDHVIQSLRQVSQITLSSNEVWVYVYPNISKLEPGTRLILSPREVAQSLGSDSELEKIDVSGYTSEDIRKQVRNKIQNSVRL